MENWTENRVLEVVRSAIREVAEGGNYEHVGMETRLASLGLDSMAAVEMAVCVEDRLGLVLPDSGLAQAVTIGDVVRTLQERIRTEAQS